MNKLSEPAKHILSLLWKDGTPMSTNFRIGGTYEINGRKFKATEDLYEELVEYQKHLTYPYKIYRIENVVNLVGVKVPSVD